jgi:hypothetical protein
MRLRHYSPINLAFLCPGCYALMPTRTEALAEFEKAFGLIEAEFRDSGATLPADTTDVVHA